MNASKVIKVRSGRYEQTHQTSVDGILAKVVFVVKKDIFIKRWVVTGIVVLKNRWSEVHDVNGAFNLAARNTKKSCLDLLPNLAARGFRTTPDGRVFLKVSSNARLIDEQQAALEVFKKLEEGKSSH